MDGLNLQRSEPRHSRQRTGRCEDPDVGMSFRGRNQTARPVCLGHSEHENAGHGTWVAIMQGPPVGPAHKEPCRPEQFRFYPRHNGRHLGRCIHWSTVNSRIYFLT